MAPATAVAFVLVSAALLAIPFVPRTAMRNGVRAAAGVVFVFACMGLLEFAGNAGVSDWEARLIGQFGTFGRVPLARMSPLTATTFALVGLGLGCLTSARSALRDLGGVLGGLTLIIGSTVALGYAYGAPLLYGGQVIPMALTTGLAFMGTGAALVALAGLTSLPLRPFSRGALRAELAETERKRAEKALHESEALARSLVEHLPQRIFVKDRNSQYLFCNSNFARVLGIDQDEIVGKDDFALFPPELAEAHRADDRTVMADGTITDRDERYEGTGEERWIHTIKVPYRDEQGEIIGVLGILGDVTERKRAEAEIGHERDRAQRYLDTAEVILLALDPKGRITLVNRYACSILGWSEDELLGRDWIETCLPARVRGALRETFYKLLDGELSVVENPILTRSGEERLIEWRNTLERDLDGRVIGTLSSGLDITERQRAEEEIQLQRLRVFKATMRTVQDIVNNFLNGLQVVHLGLEGQLPPEMQKLADQVIQEAAAKLRALGNLETIEERDMAIGPGIDYPGAPS
jgi:PAS domain S-box-containing protein